MTDKIYTAKDYAEKRDGVKTVKERIAKYQEKYRRQGISVNVTFAPRGKPVTARIWQGHWVADCECGGAEVVDYDEPIFFCWGCGNSTTKGAVRSVVFPENREAIERKILLRPVQALRGLDEIAKAECATAVISIDGKPLTHSWLPEETLEDLSEQQDAAIEVYIEGLR